MTRPMQTIVSAFVGGHPAPRLEKGRLDSATREKRRQARLAWVTALRYGRGLRLKESLDLRWQSIVAREELLTRLRRQYMAGLKELVALDAQWATVVGLCGKGCRLRSLAKKRARREREAGLHGEEPGEDSTNTSPEG